MDIHDAYAALRRPFEPAAINFRVGSKRGNVYTVLSYLDARMVAERLTEVDPFWQVQHGDVKVMRLEATRQRGGRDVRQLRASVDCKLTLAIGDEFATRSDVGEEIGDEDDIKLEKTVYSDALKRAAVQFGVGAYLYDLDMGVIPAAAVEYGRINEKTVETLRQRYKGLVQDELLLPWQVNALEEILQAAGNKDEDLRDKLAARWQREFVELMRVAYERLESHKQALTSKTK